MNFCHLHVHNEYSILDGVGSSKTYAKLAASLGQKYLALTNHGNVDGVLQHQKECKDAGIAPVAGCELYVVTDHNVKAVGDIRNHVTVLVQNQEGWCNLLKILTIANVEGFYRRPRISWDILKENAGGLVFLTGCCGSILNNDFGEFKVAELAEAAPGRVFGELMPLQLDAQRIVNQKVVDLFQKYRIDMVATNDCHYPTAESAKHQEVLLAIQSHKTWNDPTRWKFNVTGLYLKTADEMADAFTTQGFTDRRHWDRAIRRTGDVAAMCADFSLKQRPVELPAIQPFENDDEEVAFFRGIINRGFRSRVTGKDKPAYIARIKEELDLIIPMKFTKYFLIVWDLINWCKENDIMTGPGRGSVGGSLVAYLMGITDVDPLQYGLEFFRFISPDRNDLPDIDMDFEDRYRGRVRDYLEAKYGRRNVVGLSTFMTMKGKGALRDCSRVFDIPLKEVDLAAKALEEKEDGGEIAASMKTNRDCARFQARYPEVVEVACSLEGQIRGAGQHAAGICISKNDLWEGGYCNITVRKGEQVANWDKDQAEFMGLMKLDVLGLSTLSVLADFKRLDGFDFPYTDIPLNDPNVYKQIFLGETVGAFQISNPGLTRYCKEIKVNNMETLSAATALWRPGPLQSGMAESYKLRKQGKEPVPDVCPSFNRITKETFGIIVYQEQVMKVVNALAGVPMKTCDKIRKVMAKSKGGAAFNKYKQEFIDGCLEVGDVNPDEAEAIWKTLVTFAGYGFNKAHSVEYSVITYWTLWAKHRNPAAFIAASLTYSPKTRRPEFIKEAGRLGISIKLPKIGVSKATVWETDGKSVYAPFSCLNGVGDKVAEKLENSKLSPIKQAGFFTTPERTVDGVNANIVKTLEKIKAFDPDNELSKEEFKKYKDLFSF